MSLGELSCWVPDTAEFLAAGDVPWKTLKPFFAPLSPAILSMWACLVSPLAGKAAETPAEQFFPEIRRHQAEAHGPVDAMLSLRIDELWRRVQASAPARKRPARG